MEYVFETKDFRGHGGLRLAADVCLPPGSPVVVLMHGAGQTRHSWHRAAGQLVKHGYGVISLDHRGHGDSEWSLEGDYSLDAFVSDVRAVVATVQQPVILVGASLGGVIATLVAGEDASHGRTLDISGLVLVDVVARTTKEGATRIRGFMDSRPDGFVSLEEAADTIASYLPNRPRPASLNGLRKNLRQREDGRWYWHWDPAYSLARSGPIKLADRMEAAACMIKAPTLIVRGARSELVDAEGVRLLQKFIPHAEAVDVEGAHHMVAGDRNDAFNAAILGFLQSFLGPIPA